MKIAAVVEYRGSGFSGWQHQKHAGSIQQHVEAALSRVADHEVRVHCAGRTDSGVHALHQVIHFETGALRSEHSWVTGCNTYLSDDVCLVWSREIAEDFHARYSAIRRSYRYIIHNRKLRPALNHDLVTWEYQPLDVKLMQAAAADLVGEYDFTSYRAAGCQSKVPIREVQKLSVVRSGEYVVIDITANAFLQHMVRNIAGVLMAIGSGKESMGWAKRVLDACDRTKGGVTAPANGLYLTRVEYPDKYNIPGPAADSWPLLL